MPFWKRRPPTAARNAMSTPYSGTRGYDDYFTIEPDTLALSKLQFSPDLVMQWCRTDYLAYWLCHTLQLRALAEGFELVWKDDETPCGFWEQWRLQLEQLQFWDAFKQAWVFRTKYGLGLLHLTSDGIFQVIPGTAVQKVTDDPYGRPISVTLAARDEYAHVTLDLTSTYVVRLVEEGMPHGMSYLRPIWDPVRYIAWMNYSMCGAAAAEGNKMLTIGMKDPDQPTYIKVKSSLQGVSARRAFIYATDTIDPDAIKVLDTHLTPTIAQFIAEQYKAVSLYTGVPEDILTGVHAYRSGGETNVGSLYEAYAQIRHAAEETLSSIFSRFFHVPRSLFSKIKFLWQDTERQSPLQAEQVALLKAQRKGLELRYKTLAEVRADDDLPLLPNSNVIAEEPLRIAVTGLEESAPASQDDQEEAQ